MLLNHKTNEKVTAIAIHGQSHEISEIFPSFYEKCKDIFIELKYKFNYLSIDSENFKDGKIKTVSRFEKKMIEEITNKNQVRSICFFSLPENFRNCGFDYDVSIEWNKNFLLFTFSNSVNKIITNQIINDFRIFFEIDKVEIFKMSRKECPWIYVLGVNPKSSFKTLKILKIITKEDIKNNVLIFKE